MVGTWADAVWAVRFYEKHGFQVVSTDMIGKTVSHYDIRSP